MTSGLSEGRPRPPLAPGRCTPPALLKSQTCAHRATAALRNPHPPSSSYSPLASGTMQPAMLLSLLGAAALAGEWNFSTSDSSWSFSHRVSPSILPFLFPVSLASPGPGVELRKQELSSFSLLSPQGLCGPWEQSRILCSLQRCQALYRARESLCSLILRVTFDSPVTTEGWECMQVGPCRVSSIIIRALS